MPLEGDAGERLDGAGQHRQIDAQFAADRGQRRHVAGGDRVQHLDGRDAFGGVVGGGRQGQQKFAQPAAEAAHHLDQRAGFDDASGLQQRHRIADPLHHGHLVGDDQDGQAEAGLQCGDQVEDLAGGLRVERAGRLVAEQHVGVGGQRPGDADPLPLAPGQLRGKGLPRVAEPDQPEQFGRLGGSLGASDPGQFERVGDVARDGAGVEQVGVLEDQPEPAPGPAQLGRVHGGEVGAVDLDGAAGGPVEQRDASHQGRLAGTGLADDAVHRVLGHLQRHPVQGADLTVGLSVDLLEVGDCDHDGPSVCRRVRGGRGAAGTADSRPDDVRASMAGSGSGQTRECAVGAERINDDTCTRASSRRLRDAGWRGSTRW